MSAIGKSPNTKKPFKAGIIAIMWISLEGAENNNGGGCSPVLAVPVKDHITKSE